MKKENIIVLAKRKKEKKGETENTYNYLYFDKSVNVALCISSGAFHTCKDIGIIDKDIVSTTEDFDFHNFNTALLSFYYNDLQQIIDIETLNDIYNYYLETYENTNTCINDLDLLRDKIYKKEAEINIIWNLIEKWYNRDKQ